MSLWERIMNRKVLLILGVLLILSPIFGVILADAVGYHEPLDLAAEKLGLTEWDIEWTPFSDYSVPGLDPIIGYIISGIIGILVIYLIGLCLMKISSMRKEE